MIRTTRTTFAALAAFGAALCFTPEAHANGRFPGATMIVLRGQNGVMTTSFGIVTTTDAFATTNWICETSLGYDPLQNNDYGVGIFENGTIVVAGPYGLNVSTDHGCSTPRPAGEVATDWMADVSVDEQTPTTAIAVSRQPLGATSCNPKLFESTDQGQTWNAIATTFPATFCPFTLDSAPTNKKRIYVSGNVLAADGMHLIAQLLVSDDRGATWTTQTIPNESHAYIGGIDPIDPDTIYVRTTTSAKAGDLLVSHDAGKTYQFIANLTGTPLQFYGVSGFAISPDGSKIAYGSLNEGLFVMNIRPPSTPIDAGATDGGADGGTDAGTADAGFVYGDAGAPVNVAKWPVMCMRWTDGGLFAGSAPNLCGPFVVGRSTDDATTFTPVIKELADIHGDQTKCAPGTPVASMCPAQWNTFAARFRACDGGTSAPDASSGGDAGGDAGVTPPPPTDDCLCDTARLPRARPFALALLACAALVGLTRRAARRS